MRASFLRSTLLIFALAPLGAAAAETPKELPLVQHGMALTAIKGNDGWTVSLQLAKVEDGAQIRYRRLGTKDWRTLPEGDAVGPLEIGSIGTGEQVVELEILDRDGKGTGLFRLSFDPEKERIREARYLLEHVLSNDWVEFRDGCCEGEVYAYFNTVWSLKDALRSIRYSLDGCDLDREPDDEVGHLSGRFTYLCMQLTYADGEASPPRIFFKQRPGANRKRPPRPTGPKSMTPPAPGAESSVPVRLTTSRANNGWTLHFEVEDWASVAEYRYRLETDAAWRSTGELPWISPSLGRRSANSGVVLDPLRVNLGRQKVEVELVAQDGAVSGPYTLWFDPDEEILKAAKADLGDPKREWGGFGEGEDRSIFYFSVFEARDALREIRYSVDDCEVGQKFEFPPWNDIAQSPLNPETTTISVSKATEYVCVQLVYMDGETSEVRRFEHR
jgi:hypothetical protein